MKDKLEKDTKTILDNKAYVENNSFPTHVMLSWRSKALNLKENLDHCVADLAREEKNNKLWSFIPKGSNHPDSECWVPTHQLLNEIEKLKNKLLELGENVE
jgi:hypothetical protein